jgi:hypothetical protein
VTVVPVAAASADLVVQADLLVVGGPTHMHGLSTASSRQFAAKTAAKPGSGQTLDSDVGGPGLRGWLGSLADRRAVAAAFDTRLTGIAALTGCASSGMSRLLRRHGYFLVVPPESFLVSQQNVVVDGEAAQAALLGRRARVRRGYRLRSRGRGRPLAAVLPAVQRGRQAHHPRFINHERADTLLGSVVVVVGAGALMIAGAYAARGTALAGHFTDALGVARALGHKDTLLGTLFAIVLLDASIIGAGAVTLSTSYAIGDFFGLKHSLHRSFRDAPAFYAVFAGLVAIAAGIVLIPGAPLGIVTEAVQALAGLLLPSASVFLLLLCNDREVLGPWVNRAWLNIVATVIIATLLMLSGTLMATTMFPRLNGARIAVWLSVALAAGLTAAGIALRISRKRRGQTASPPRIPRDQRNQWRMPPLALLKPVTWSPALNLAMLVLRGYLVIAALLLLVKAIQLGTG